MVYVFIGGYWKYSLAYGGSGSTGTPSKFMHKNKYH